VPIQDALFLVNQHYEAAERLILLGARFFQQCITFAGDVVLDGIEKSVKVIGFEVLAGTEHLTEAELEYVAENAPGLSCAGEGRFRNRSCVVSIWDSNGMLQSAM